MLDKKSKTDKLSPDKLSEHIRALTLQRNAVEQLSKASGRIVWATTQVLNEYAGQRDYDKDYEALCAKMCKVAQDKMNACDKWLVAANAEIERLLALSEKRFHDETN